MPEPRRTSRPFSTVLAVLGDRDPLQVLNAAPADLEQALHRLPREALGRLEASGKWTILQVVQHLADTELVYGYRLRLMLTEQTPKVTSFDQDAWVRDLDYAGASLEQALDQFQALRTGNLRLYQGLRAPQWDRKSIHPENGEETVRMLSQRHASHDLTHLAQIGRIRKAVA